MLAARRRRRCLRRRRRRKRRQEIAGGPGWRAGPGRAGLSPSLSRESYVAPVLRRLYPPLPLPVSRSLYLAARWRRIRKTGAAHAR